MCPCRLRYRKLEFVETVKQLRAQPELLAQKGVRMLQDIGILEEQKWPAYCYEKDMSVSNVEEIEVWARQAGESRRVFHFKAKQGQQSAPAFLLALLTAAIRPGWFTRAHSLRYSMELCSPCASMLIAIAAGR